jgi:hypothetical protein
VVKLLWAPAMKKKGSCSCAIWCRCSGRKLGTKSSLEMANSAVRESGDTVHPDGGK